jgi:hypothetical protein
VREKYCWLVAGGWFVLREKYCWLMADKPNEQAEGYGSTSSLTNDSLKHTRKHEKKEGAIEPKSKAARLWRTVRPGRADCPRWPRGPSGRVPRTVRTLAADCPAGAADRPLKRTEPPEPTPEKRTIREDRADYPRGPRTVRY